LITSRTRSVALSTPTTIDNEPRPINMQIAALGLGSKSGPPDIERKNIRVAALVSSARIPGNT
jgi:hypothetical protein